MTAPLTFIPAPSRCWEDSARAPSLVVIEGGRSPRRLQATYRRRRALALVIALVVGLVAVAGVRVAVATVTPQTQVQARPPQSVRSTGRVAVVRPGDTLWSIARRAQPTGDVRALVDRLAAGHGGAGLQPGERIPLPAG